MIVLHHLNNSRSQRILWLLEELGLPYEIKKYQRDPLTMLAPPELKRIHPLGKSPVITDGDLVLAESGAIIEYLVDTYGPQLKPKPGTPEFIRYKYWLHFAEGSAMPPLLLSLVFNKIETSPMPFFIRPIAKGISQKVRKSFFGPALKNNFEFMDQELKKSPWFAGEEFSGADIQMSFPLEAGLARGGVDLPHVKEFLKKIHAREAYKRALARGGEYQILGSKQ